MTKRLLGPDEIMKRGDVVLHDFGDFVVYGLAGKPVRSLEFFDDTEIFHGVERDDEKAEPTDADEERDTEQSIDNAISALRALLGGGLDD